MANNERPLSPFMIGTHYNPQLTSMLSILHRITGFGLAIGAFMGTWWLVSIMLGSSAYETFHGFAKSFIGQLMLFCWLYAFVYHFLNGIRHMVWDTGRWLDLKNTYRSGWTVFILSLVLSVVLWFRMG